MRNMNQLIYLTIVFSIVFYIQCYLQSSKSVEIIQTTLETFNPNLLYEKQPIYLYDSIVNPADLLHTTFKYQYMYHVLSLSNQSYLKKNMSRFLIIYNDSDEPVNISLIHPIHNKTIDFYKGYLQTKNYKVCKNNTDAFNRLTTIDVILKTNNCLILPLNWTYMTHADNLLEIHVFDGMSAVYSFVA